MIITPWSYAHVVTGAAQAVLTELGLTPEAAVDVTAVRFLPLTPGNIAWDNCDCSGQLAFTIQRIVPTTTYPIDGSNQAIQGGCQPPGRMAECLASWNRCVPGMDAQGKAPTEVQLYASALLFQGAQFAMEKALYEYFCAQRNSRPQGVFDFRIGASTFPGPDGNCASVEIPFNFLLR